MLAWVQKTRHTTPAHGFSATFRHLGAFGLFLLAILDSSPLPTFGGPDILTAILAASHRNPWWGYPIVATAGSVIGAIFTFRLARRAGEAYLEGKFGKSRITAPLRYFKKWGTSALAVSTAVPFPFPTSLFFAAAGASDYPQSRFLIVVALCRAARYVAIAYVADRLGRHVLGVIRHPVRYWPWLLLIAASVAIFSILAMRVSRRLSADVEDPKQPSEA